MTTRRRKYSAPHIVAKAMHHMVHGDEGEGVEKAFTTGDFAGGAGLMLPKNAKRFLHTVLEHPTIASADAGTNVRFMESKTEDIDRIGFGTRILKPLTEDSAMTVESKPTATQIKLVTTEFGAWIPASYTLIEDILEGKTSGDQAPGSAPFMQTIEMLIRERVAVDMEDLWLNSDTGDADPDMDEFDGILKLSGKTYDHGSDVITTKLFENMLAEMDSAYLQRMGGLAFWVGPKTELYLRAHLGKRGTDLGDRLLVATPGGGMAILGVPVRVVGKIPETLGGSGKETKIWLGPPSMVRMGIWRDVTLEVERVPGKRRFNFFVTIRIGVKLEDPAGCVTGSAITVAA